MNLTVKTKEEVKENKPKEETKEIIGEETKEEIKQEEPKEEEEKIIDDPNKIILLEEMTKILKDQIPKKCI